jgi:hypothetical protein
MANSEQSVGKSGNSWSLLRHRDEEDRWLERRTESLFFFLALESLFVFERFDVERADWLGEHKPKAVGCLGS